MTEISPADQTPLGRVDLHIPATSWLTSFAVVAASFVLGWALLTWLVWVLQGPSGSELIAGAALTILGALATGSAAMGYALRRQRHGVSLWSTTALTLAVCIALALALLWAAA